MMDTRVAEHWSVIATILHLLVVSSVNLVSSERATLAASSLSSSPSLKLSLSDAKTSIDHASEAVSATSSKFEVEERFPSPAKE